MADRFDTLLRRGLMDANLSQYRPVWEAAGEPVYSPRYLRERRRMLLDPMGWMRRKLRPVWRRVLRSAACVLLAGLIALGTLMAASPTVRAAVLNWLRELSGRMIVYQGTGAQDSDTGAERTAAWDYRPAWIPEGWVLQEVEGSGGSAHWMYRRREGEGRGILNFYCLPPGNHTSMTTGVTDAVAEEALTAVTIQGNSADYYVGPNNAVLAWEDPAGRFFCLNGSWLEDPALLLEIAEGVTFHPESGTAYEALWIPEGCRKIQDFQINGGGEILWLPEDGNAIVFFYAQDSAVPFRTPDGDPERVDIHGVTARYWSGEEPEPNPENHVTTYTVDGKTVTTNSAFVEVNGATVSVASFPGGVMESALCWTDPDTRTELILRGIAKKEVLIRIAENIRPCERRPMEKLPGTYFNLSGTVGKQTGKDESR